MSLYRVKQFLWGITANFKKVDYKLINKYLNADEKQLFEKLNHKDKMHSIRVCEDALNTLKEKKFNIDKHKVAKAALLHDIGKVELALGVVEKSTLVMLNKLTNGKLRKYDNIKRIDIYYNHGKKGSKLLQALEYQDHMYDNDFFHCIENHHSDIKESELLEIIRECDNKN